MSKKNELSAIAVLEDMAARARENAVLLAKGESADFQAGLRFAYQDILSALIERAELHGVSLSDIGLADYDPYKDAHLAPPDKRAA